MRQPPIDATSAFDEFMEGLEAGMAADPAGVRHMGREMWLMWEAFKAGRASTAKLAPAPDLSKDPPFLF